jgi:hypothetical protein
MCSDSFIAGTNLRNKKPIIILHMDKIECMTLKLHCVSYLHQGRETKNTEVGSHILQPWYALAPSHLLIFSLQPEKLWPVLCLVASPLFWECPNSGTVRDSLNTCKCLWIPGKLRQVACLRDPLHGQMIHSPLC